MADRKECVLYDRECNHCGECERCDYNPDKICDNCGLCIDSAEDYSILPIDEIILDENTKKTGNA